MNDHEQGILRFLVEPGRGRMRTLLELGDKRRADLRSLLDHAVRLDPRLSRHVSGGDAFPEPIGKMLRVHGASATCFVLASDADLDGREMPLDEALNAIIGMGGGAFVSCIPGKLAFYEGAEMKSSYLLCG